MRQGFSSVFFLFFPLSVSLSIQRAPAYSGAEFRTSAAYLYGKFETRMKSAAGSGLLSSFFAYSDASYPLWNEIDVEILGQYRDQIQFNHITGQAGGPAHHVHELPVNFNPHESFNTYAFEWYPDSLIFYVNGKAVYRSAAAVKDLAYPQKIMMNIWVSGYTSWVGSFSANTLPVHAYYDWVAYSTYTPGQGPGGSHFTPAWKEEFNQANPPGWEKATHTFDGNLATFTPLNATVQGGMAILSLTEKGKEGYQGQLPDPTSVFVFARGKSNRDRDSLFDLDNPVRFPSGLRLDGRLARPWAWSARFSRLEGWPSRPPSLSKAGY